MCVRTPGARDRLHHRLLRSEREADATSSRWRSSPDSVSRRLDLRTADLRALLDGASVIFHQAGQPGVRMSWGSGFSDYCEHNIKATQRLLEAAKAVATPRFVYASSSSVYGNAASYPTRETDLPRPNSPYGVTKLAAEHLCCPLHRQLGTGRRSPCAISPSTGRASVPTWPSADWPMPP